jgi:hypothetical protein
MTAAHCIPKTFGYEYNNKIYIIDIKPNIFHPTKESIFTCYVGAHKTIREDMDISPAQAFSVKSIIIVRNYNKLIFLKIKVYFF